MENTATTNQDINTSFIVYAYKNLPTMLFVNFAASLSCIFIFYSYDAYLAISFFAIVLLMTIIRLYTWKKFTTAHSTGQLTANDIHFWHLSYSFFLSLSGVIWAVLGIVAICCASKEIEYPIIIIMSALGGGATAVTAPLKYTGKIYITLLLLPIAFAFAAQGTWHYSLLAVLDLIFVVVMLLTHEKNHVVLKNSLTLRYRNNNLINDLREINNNLEKTVEYRTQELKEIANKDALTGIANRRGLMEWMGTNLASANDTNNAAILFLDLDRFKEINDAKGHELGDEVLKMTAHRFQSCCGDDAILARWGGDEFIIITPPSPEAVEVVNTLAEQLIEEISKPFIINDESLSLGLSIGSAYYPTDAPSFKEAIHAADLAAAEVKRTGRGKLITFNGSYADVQKNRFELSRALGIAVENNELTVNYQPIINAKTGEIDSFEALARWTYNGQAISPEFFISLAEQTDRISALGDFILRTACTEAALWLKLGHPQKIAVNVSVKQLLSGQFSHTLSAILKQTMLPPTQLKIEVTESLFDDNYKDKVYDTVIQVRDLGVAIQIDDFGTGYSSLSRLHQFPISTIKIDQSFVSQIHHQGHAIIKSTILIARSFNLQIIAEGVETAEQAAELYTMGVDYFQGYFFRKPSAELHFDAFETSWKRNDDKA